MTAVWVIGAAWITIDLAIVAALWAHGQRDDDRLDDFEDACREALGQWTAADEVAAHRAYREMQS